MLVYVAGWQAKGYTAVEIDFNIFFRWDFSFMFVFWLP